MVQMDTDVTEIPKRMAIRFKAEGRVLLGTAAKTILQTLAW
jgi:hypothetical protein